MLSTATTSTVIIAQLVFNGPVQIGEKAVLCLLAVVGIAAVLTAVALYVRSKR